MISIDLTMISNTTTVTQKTSQKTPAQRHPEKPTDEARVSHELAVINAI